MNEEMLIEKIREYLILNLPDNMKIYVEEFDEMLKKNHMRASYKILDDLIRDKRWEPSDYFKGLVKAYQIVF